MHTGNESHTVAGAAAVIHLVCPHGTPGKGVQRKPRAVIQENRPGHVDVALQHPGVILALVVGQGPHRIGPGDVGGAAVVLAAVIHQQESAPLDLAVDLALGMVMHHRRVGTPGRNGRETVLKIARLLGTALLQHLFNVSLVELLALGQRLLQVHLEPDHRHAVPDMAFPDVLQLHLVLHALQRKDGIGARYRLVGRQRRVQVKVGGLLVHQEHLAGIHLAHRVQQIAVAADGHAVFRQRGGVGVSQPSRRHKQRAVPGSHQRIGHRQRRAGQIPRPQVQQPAHTVKTRHGQRRGTRLGQLFPHPGYLLRRRGAGLGHRQQLAGGIGQRRTLAGGIPDGAGHVLALQRSTVLGKNIGILVGQVRRHTAAVQKQRLPGFYMGRQVLRHRGHPRRTGMHALDLGARQLLVRLDIEPAVTPQRRTLLGHHQGGILAGKAGEPRQGIVVGRQILAAMRVAGHQQNGVCARGFRGGTQRGNLFIGCQRSTLPCILTCFHHTTFY